MATLSSYLTLVPRGLQEVVSKLIKKELSSYHLKVSFLGEPSHEQDREYVHHLRSLVHQKRKDHQAGSEEISLSAPPVGTVHDTGTGRHVSFGYRTEDSNIETKQHAVVSHPGHLEGAVWLQLDTDAPTHVVSDQLRCIGPLISLIRAWEHDGDWTEAQSLEDATSYIRKLVSSSSSDDDDYPFASALNVWHDHVRQSWPVSDEERASIRRKVDGESPMRFRLSCARSKSDRYQYTRQQFLRSIAEAVVPASEAEKWVVDLNGYDVEVVVLVQTRCLAIGFALRPYRQLGAKGFSSGTIPPDVSPPYLSGSILSGLVRLRPTTAQVLLHLARIRLGDIVLDPCAGIGTIPMEVLSERQAPAVGVGGDVVLTQDGLGGIAAQYASSVRQRAKTGKGRSSGVANLVAWDAASLPLRPSLVDVIVSDLPFGQQCMSSSKLTIFLPLVLSEMARVLRQGSGRMVLLCGSYQPVLAALHNLNKIPSTQEASKANGENPVWILPCASVFPVNVGGLLAWIIQVQRGAGEYVRDPNHAERIRKLTARRDCTKAHRKREAAVPAKPGRSKYKRIQS